MTVADFLEELQMLQAGSDDDISDLEIHFGYDYGDHARVIVAPKVGEVDVGHVMRSDYHRMDKVVDVDDVDEDDRPKVRQVILIR